MAVNIAWQGDEEMGSKESVMTAAALLLLREVLGGRAMCRCDCPHGSHASWRQQQPMRSCNCRCVRSAEEQGLNRVLGCYHHYLKVRPGRGSGHG
eukprot:361005-Chlamydomonas_euryale.AAC.11